MSSFMVGAADIDAVVSVAASWTEQGILEDLPASLRRALTVTPDTATGIGRILWRANYDANLYGGPPEFADPAWLESEEFAEQFEPMPDYAFRRFEGVPTPLVALRVIGFYSYQTDGDAWREDEFRPDGLLPFPALFTFAMRARALELAGADLRRSVVEELAEHPNGSRINAVTTDIIEAENELDRRRRLSVADDQLPWGLSDADRDLFTRDADA